MKKIILIFIVVFSIGILTACTNDETLTPAEHISPTMEDNINENEEIIIYDAIFTRPRI